MVSARRCRDNTLWQRSRKRAPPKCAASLILVLSDDAKQAVVFVSDSGRKVNSVSQRKKIPQTIKLERRAIGTHQCLVESAGDRVVIVDATISEIADPEFVAFHKRKSPWCVELAV